jgi:cytochrome c
MTGPLDARPARPRVALFLGGVVLIAALAPGRTAFATGDAAHGAQVYKTCGICHAFDKNGVGPKHTGVFGRTAGTVPDYRYSQALQKSGIVWNDAMLDKWLADPQALVPGTKMFFALDNAKDRADVIEYLKQKGGTPTP